jgi:xanthine/uracil/vitamin C permease (AzgA family)
LALGFVSFVVLKVVLGRYKEIRAAMWLIAGLSLAFLAIRWWPAVAAMVGDAQA